MAAPIQRYSDPRLHGSVLVRPFQASIQWIRTVNNPIHPKSNLIVECAVRALKVITGVFALALTSGLALVGRIIQVIHYHSLSGEKRANPKVRIIDGLALPWLQTCNLPTGQKFHGTNDKGAIGILRWGFKPCLSGKESKMAEAVYVSARDTVSASYGDNQLILSLNLREREIAYLSDEHLKTFATQCDMSNKTSMASIRKLFLMNGFRAIRYDLAHHGREVALAVYDPSCLKIIKLRRSPLAAPPIKLENKPTKIKQEHLLPLLH